MSTAIPLPDWEYNFHFNQIAAMERAFLVLMDERGVHELTIGNVYLYRAEGDHIGCWFVDETGNRLKDLDYALAYGAVERR